MAPRRPALRLQLTQEPPAEPEPASRRGDPHALDLSGVAAVQLESAATDWFIPQPGDQDQPVGLAEFVSIGRDAASGVEPSLESRVEVVEVLLKAVPDNRRSWLRRPVIETSPAVRSRSTVPIASRRRVRCSSSSGSTRDQAKPVTASVEQVALGSTGLAQLRDPNPPDRPDSGSTTTSPSASSVRRSRLK